MKKQIPKHIMDNYGFCAMCGGWNEIVHISEFDQETRTVFQLMSGVQKAWVVNCEDCDNLGFIKEKEA